MASTDGAERPASAMAGTLLRVARESAGLSIDMVAQQLKLAPRQVKALEDGDYTHLPGRTFVRGFVRNYARLVHLDPERVLQALPAGAAAPALESPTLHSTAPTIGELPTTDHAKASWARWAIPLTLAAIVAAAAVYEWMRPPGEVGVGAGKNPPAKSENAAPSPAPSPAPQSGPGTALPNPLALAASPTVAAAATPSSGATATAAGPAAAEQPLLLAFRDYSWTEVRDRDGRVLLSGMNPGGTAQTLSGTPPFEIVIGNAVDVTVRYKGESVDLAPHTRQNVARMTLR